MQFENCLGCCDRGVHDNPRKQWKTWRKLQTTVKNTRKKIVENGKKLKFAKKDFCNKKKSDLWDTKRKLVFPEGEWGGGGRALKRKKERARNRA